MSVFIGLWVGSDSAPVECGLPVSSDIGVIVGKLSDSSSAASPQRLYALLGLIFLSDKYKFGNFSIDFFFNYLNKKKTISFSF